jgi:hypothetical protein
MTWILTAHRRGCAAASLLLLLIGGGLTGCGDPLDVSDPTTILDDDVDNAEGAQLLRHAALQRLYLAVAQSALESGLVADEFLNQPSPFTQQQGVARFEGLLDRRATAEHVQRETGFTSTYSSLQDVRLRGVPVAIAKLQAHAPPGAREAHVGEMFAARGYAALRLAEDICPGFPLHDVVDYKVVYGPPLSTEEAFERALQDLDSALIHAADSARVLNFARVSRARTLLNLGRFGEAASAVAEVPTDYVAEAEYSSTVDPSILGNKLAIDQPGWGFEDFVLGRRGVADREGGTGLDFVSAADPRVPTDSLDTALDGVTILYGIGKYPDGGAPIVIASGVEARLIEAEAALNAGDPGTWLTRLNQLRQIVALPDTTDPGSDAGRIDLTFRERAFWLFATGHRLGDLRRLVRVYGRPAESVFPTGAYWLGGVYGTGTSLPIPTDETMASPGVTGCTSF